MRKLLSLVCTFTLLWAVALCDGSLGLRAKAAQKSRTRKSNARGKVKPSEPSPAEVAARREEIHRLMLGGKYQHDGAGELLYIGDMSSVPALLRVLKDYAPQKSGDGKYLYICTAAHALAALRKIAKTDAGGTYEEWSAWWEQYQKAHPVR